ncbi:MAG: hypothetical protein RLZZ40_279, partial [Actinomycetota bacterium]
MSDHFDSSRNASGDSVNPESGQFLSRRERRLSEAAQNAGPTLESTPVYQPPTIETPAGLVSSPAPAQNPEPTVEPVSPVPEFVTPQVPVPEPQPEPVTSVVSVAEPEPVPAQLTTGPIPHIEKTPTGSIPAITAPDVATLTPIATPRATPIGRRLRNRVAESGRMRLRPDALKRRTLPKVGRALRWAAKEARSSTQRIFIVTLIGAFFLAFTLPSTGFNMDLPGFAATNNDDGQRVEAASGGDVATEISLDSFKVSSYGMVRGWSVASGYWAYKVNKTGPI